MIFAGGSALLGCAADPSDPRRRRRQPAAKGLTSPVVARIRRKHRRPRRPCQRIWQCAPIYSSSVVAAPAREPAAAEGIGGRHAAAPLGHIRRPHAAPPSPVQLHHPRPPLYPLGWRPDLAAYCRRRRAAAPRLALLRRAVSPPSVAGRRAVGAPPLPHRLSSLPVARAGEERCLGALHPQCAFALLPFPLSFSVLTDGKR